MASKASLRQVALRRHWREADARVPGGFEAEDLRLVPEEAAPC
jgi:hypothetical protein